jgi:5-oxoprolinase (ATP-hydrolysing)
VIAVQSGWHFFVDRGGTFTDIVAIGPDRRLTTLKLLSQNPAHYDDAALTGIERILASADPDARSIASVKMGTTLGTNALLERRGAPTVLVITAGFADLLRIGTQQRPDIFALDIRLPDMLYGSVIEARERIDTNGAILKALDEEQLAEDLAAARRAGFESVAIAFVNAYREPRHEQIAARIAADSNFACVSVSTDINPTIRIVDRGDTAVVDAYLTPVLDAYKAKLRAGFAGRLADERLLFMQSHGGLVEADDFRGADSVLSGPAGGVVGMATTAVEAGFDEVVGFDMGGTSTDVSVYPGHYERSAGDRIAGCRIARPMLRIHTVAAGGGSLLDYRGGRLQVGPASAGARPGPACYRNGGPLTLTDANVLLGRIQAEHFPRVFGPGADETIDTDIVATDFAALARRIAADGGGKLEPEELAEGFLRIAIEHMAQAIEQISVQRGHDITRFALSCFGGAGGQFACGIADTLGIATILVGPLSGVLSAYGIGIAERRSIRAAGIHAGFDARSLERAKGSAARLEAGLRRSHEAVTQTEWRAFLRVAGSDTLLALPFDGQTRCAALAEKFHERHEQRFGFASNESDLILQSIEVEAIAASQRPVRTAEPRATGGPGVETTRRIRFGGCRIDAPVRHRSGLSPDTPIAGPAMIVEPNATIIVEPGWTAAIDANDMLVLRRVAAVRRGETAVRRGQAVAHRDTTSRRADPIMLEVFNNQFMHVAEQMGVVLEQTAHSVNIKERLDYSCALFDRGGELVANAPHVPVHLGSMGDSVREVVRSAPGLSRGDAYLLNAPYRGGTHLPDLTVVTPVFEADATGPAFFVASRAHHADIGGITPGSMPATSRSIDEEGVVIEPLLIVRDGRLREAAILDCLGAGTWPARRPAQNLADIKAQLAANARGRQGLARLLERYGSDVVHAYMRHVRDNAANCTRRALGQLVDGRFTARLDGGEQITVAVTIDRSASRARIDFSGTSGMSAGNLNAPLSVVRAVVLYVLRTLIRENIPLNAGCLEPIDLVVPTPSLLAPVHPAAVAGGNVETSQCIADALLAALGAAAASQGTMNNLSFGDSERQYYETICGGCGAGPDFAGASAVHSHMTNSRLTDVEILEQRFPVRVRRFEIRRGSGGEGQHRGGDGAIREIEFLAPMRLSLLASRRVTAPYGLAGGRPGQTGRDTVIRADGAHEHLAPTSEVEVAAGDRILIETPGGGGFGPPPEKAPKKGSKPFSEKGL